MEVKIPKQGLTQEMLWLPERGGETGRERLLGIETMTAHETNAYIFIKIIIIEIKMIS